MDPSKFLNDLAKRIMAALPEQAHTLKSDVEKNVHSVLRNTFAKLELVTREEFDTQTKVLARSRKKIDTLEQKIDELEKLIRESKNG